MNTTRIEINTGILELYQEKYKINPEYISEAIQDMVLEKVKDEVMEYNNQNKDNQISITHTMIYKLKTLRNKKIERQKIAAILNRIDADETDYIPQYTNHIKQEIKEFQEIQEPGEIIKIASTSENDDSEYLHIITNRNAYTINTEIGLQKRTPIKNIIRDEETINLYTRYESKEENEKTKSIETKEEYLYITNKRIIIMKEGGKKIIEAIYILETTIEKEQKEETYTVKIQQKDGEQNKIPKLTKKTAENTIELITQMVHEQT